MITNKLTKQLALVLSTREKINEALIHWKDCLAISDSNGNSSIETSLVAIQQSLKRESENIEGMIVKHHNRFNGVSGVLTANIVAPNGLTKRVACVRPHNGVDEPSIPESFYTSLQKCLNSNVLWTTEDYPIYVVSRTGKIVQTINPNRT